MITKLKSAFTLIELMIAVSLGMVVVYTVVAGFRMASSSITVANRMALENNLMRAGYFSAIEEADFWQSIDDPNTTDAHAQMNRTSALLSYNHLSSQRGMAFTPFRQLNFTCASPTSGESDRGWDPAYQWPASDSRTWYHGQLVEFQRNIDGKFGIYGIFTHLKEAPELNATSLNNSANLTGYGTARPLHTWLPNQLEGIKNALGYFGLYDYLPANTLFGYYGQGPWGDQSLSQEWSNPDSPNTSTPNGSPFKLCGFSQGYDYSTVNGRNRNTNAVSFPIVPSSPFTDSQTNILAASELIGRNHSSWVTNTYQAAETSAGVSGFLSNALNRQPLTPLHPSHWPEVHVEVARYVNQCRFVTLCRIRLNNPLTGAESEASFTVLSTSLRGARQQRRTDGGWARWDNSASDPVLRSYDATLDTQ